MANAVPRYELPFDTDMVCAPQVFFFRPHGCWYLIAQGRIRGTYGPVFSTSPSLRNPNEWAPLQPLAPPTTFGPGLDFWVIGSDRWMHLFFTTGDGSMWRAWTPVECFPGGWTLPTLAVRDDLFEAGHIYQRTNGRFVCIVEARRRGLRYQRRFDAESLWGPWRPSSTPFATARQSTAHDRWTDHISHGELVRAGFDERMQLGSAPPQFVFQGMKRIEGWPRPYGRWPWRLGLLTATAPL